MLRECDYARPDPEYEFSRFWVEQGIDGLSLNADRLRRMRQVVRGQEDGV